MPNSYAQKQGTSFRRMVYSAGVPTIGSPQGFITGNVYFVDPGSGSDGYNGLSKRAAFKTLQKGIDTCVAARGDVIIRMKGGEAVTSTVLFNKLGITVVADVSGINPRFVGEYYSTYSSTLTADPVALISQPCTLIGLGFAGVDAGATFYDGAALLLRGSLSDTATAEPFGVHLYNCRFPKWGMANRIGIGIDGSSDCLIEHCTFEGVGGDFESGIYLQGAAQNIEISDCKFSDCDYALTLGAFAGGGPYLDFNHNTVIGADSKGVNTQANTAVGVIRNNWFNTDVGASTYDRTVDQLDTQGIQCMGNHYKDEDPGPT